MQSNQQMKKMAFVYGTLPTHQEVAFLRSFSKYYKLTIVSSEAILDILFADEKPGFCDLVTLENYDENPGFLPKLVDNLEGFDFVVLKERLGVYCYQTIKAKMMHNFKLFVWVDNLLPFSGEDIDETKSIKRELSFVADGFIVQTKEAEYALLAEGESKKNIYFLTAFLEEYKDNRTQDQCRVDLGLSHDDLCIFYHGPLEWEENIQDLMLACRFGINKNIFSKDKIKILISGIGTCGSWLQNKAVELGLQKQVKFYAASKSSIYSLLYASDACFVSTSPSIDRVEGDPFRLLLPMSMNKPILSARTVLADEIIGKHRIDYCLGSYSSLAGGLKKISRAKALLSDLSSKNQEKIKLRFNSKKNQENLEFFYKNTQQKSSVPQENIVENMIAKAKSYIDNRQFKTAIEFIEGAFEYKKIPNHQMANLYRLMGDSFSKLNDQKSAKDSYEISIKYDPYVSKTFIGIGTSCLADENFHKAIVSFQKAITLDSKNDLAHLGLGLSFHGVGEHEEAFKWIQSSLDHNFQNKAAIYTLVRYASSEIQFDACVHYLQKYLEHHSLDVDIRYTLAAIFYKKNEYDMAMKIVENVLELDPFYEKACALKRELQNLQSQSESISS